MRATNTVAAAAVTSIDGARVDGDWRVTGKKEEEGGAEKRRGERRRAQRSSTSMEEEGGRCLKGEMDYVRDGRHGFLTRRALTSHCWVTGGFTDTVRLSILQLAQIERKG